MARKKGWQIPLRRKQSFLPQQLQHLRPLDFLHHCQVGWYKLNLRLPHRLVGKAIPDYNLCDLVVYRQAPVVARSDGMVMNNFSGMWHYMSWFLQHKFSMIPKYLEAQQIRVLMELHLALQTQLILHRGRIWRIRSAWSRSRSCEWSTRQVQLDCNYNT